MEYAVAAHHDDDDNDNDGVSADDGEDDNDEDDDAVGASLWLWAAHCKVPSSRLVYVCESVCMSVYMCLFVAVVLAQAADTVARVRLGSVRFSSVPGRN